MIAVIGDIHAQHDLLAQVLSVAVERGATGALLVGDIGPNWLTKRTNLKLEQQWRGALAEVLARVEKSLPFLFVPGNHDLQDVPHPHNADGKLLDLGGYRVYGIGGAGPQKFDFPYEWSEADIQARPSPECDILLCHCPPIACTLDQARSLRHCGSYAIRQRALQHRGVLVCGHIHEAYGVEQIGQCLCLNAGALGAPWASPQLGFVVSRDHVFHLDLKTGKETHLHRADLAT